MTSKDHNITWYKKECDRQMSVLVRSKDRCEKCGNTSFNSTLQHAHVVGRGNMTLRWDIINGMCLCASCHLWWHHEPIDSGVWFRQRFPERMEYLDVARLKFTKRSISDYQELLDNIKNHNLDKLRLKEDDFYLLTNKS